MANDAEIAKLAERLGLPTERMLCGIPWVEPGEESFFRQAPSDCPNWKPSETGGRSHTSHIIEPPDLLSPTGFSVMVEAALRMGLDIHLEMKPYGDFIASITKANNPDWADGIDPDKAVALAKALSDYFETGDK